MEDRKNIENGKRTREVNLGTKKEARGRPNDAMCKKNRKENRMPKTEEMS